MPIILNARAGQNTGIFRSNRKHTRARSFRGNADDSPRDIARRLDGFTVNLPSFLNWHHAGLMEMKALDRDVTRDEAEFEEVVARLDPKMRSALERLQAGSTRISPRARCAALPNSGRHLAGTPRRYGQASPVEIRGLIGLPGSRSRLTEQASSTPEGR